MALYSRLLSRGIRILVCLSVFGFSAGSVLAADSQTSSTTTTVFATGLNNPRGLTFGPDGNLYVAQGGTGGTGSTVGQCEQVVPPVGPYTGSPNDSSIVEVSPNGTVSTVAGNLPSSQTSAATGGLVSGVSAVAFLDGKLYALLAGAGCSHGVSSMPNGVFRVNGDGSVSLVANLSAFWQSHPVANPEPGDFEPDGTPYSMVAARGALYVVEPNHGEIDRVTPDGAIERVVDVSAYFGHVVPTSIAYHGDLFVGNLGTFPVEPGTQHVYRVPLSSQITPQIQPACSGWWPGCSSDTQSGQITQLVDGLSAVVGVTFDAHDRMYVLEMSTEQNGPTPGNGTIVRLSPTGSMETLVSDLNFPTAMTFGPDGALYVSNQGFGFPAGAGQILRITVP